MILILIFTNDELYLIRARDPAAFEKLYREYSSKIYNFLIIKVNGDQHTAEELLSDTFHSALVSAPRLNKVSKIQSWLVQIAQRRFIDHLRKKYRKPQTEEYEDFHQTDVNNPDEAIDEKDKVIMLNLALDALKDKYKKILQLKYIEKKSQKEIARLLKTSVSSVESTLFRAREALKKKLHQLAEEGSHG